jgi:predicted ATPase
LEEPENGIHPERIPAMLRLLADLAVSTDIEVGSDNPLRQVIVNTHSPAVVGQVAGDDLLVAVPELVPSGEAAEVQPRFRWMKDTWRAKAWPEKPALAPWRT